MLPRTPPRATSAPAHLPAAALVVLALAVGGSALAAEPEDYRATWRHDPGAGDAEAVEAAIADAASDFPLLVRGLVARRLRASADVSSILVMEPGDGAMTIRSEWAAWTSDLKGTPTQVEARGKPVELARWMDSGVLHAVGRRGTSSKTFVFHLGDDGRTMTMQVTTENPNLKRPLVYSLHYVKDGPAKP